MKVLHKTLAAMLAVLMLASVMSLSVAAAPVVYDYDAVITSRDDGTSTPNSGGLYSDRRFAASWQGVGVVWTSIAPFNGSVSVWCYHCGPRGASAVATPGGMVPSTGIVLAIRCSSGSPHYADFSGVMLGIPISGTVPVF